MIIKDLMVNHIQEILDLDDIRGKVIIEKQVVDIETRNIVDHLIKSIDDLQTKNIDDLLIKNILRVIKYN
jgi:hypothetical protein